MVGPTASLTPLTRADGSASYKCPSSGFDVLGSVNAPVELPGRRDALKPEEATIEVFVKPGTTPGGVGERYVEGILKTMLGRLILGREKGYPRRGVVLTLAIVGGQNICRGDSYLTLLPALLHASLLALISASVPLSMTFTASILAVTLSGDIIRQPSVSQAATAKSLHVLAFSSKGHLLLNESQGTFDFATWERVYQHASTICGGTLAGSADGDVNMEEERGERGLNKFMRETIEDKVYQDYAWKIDAA